MLTIDGDTVTYWYTRNFEHCCVCAP